MNHLALGVRTRLTVVALLLRLGGRRAIVDDVDLVAYDDAGVCVAVGLLV